MAAGIAFRGHRACTCVAASLPVVEKVMLMRGLINDSIDIMQGCYVPGFGASAGTHDAGGCIDVAQRSPAQIQVFRECGWAMQERIGVGSGPHSHGFPWGCPHLSPAAQAQARDWERRDAGLVGNAKVEGMWPVPHWKTALAQKEKEVSDFSDEIVDRVSRRVLAELKPKLDDLPRRVWSADVIPDVWVNNPKNKTVQAGNAANFIGADIKAVRAALKTLSADVKQWQAQEPKS